MARELGPKNIHVAHVVIDGMIDNRRTRERMADRARDLPADGMLATGRPASLGGEVLARVLASPREGSACRRTKRGGFSSA